MSKLKDLILKSTEDLKKQVVDMPTWGCKIVVKAMTGAVRDLYESELAKQLDREGRIVGSMTMPKMRALVRCLFDEDNVQIFTDKDIEALSNKSAESLNKLWETVLQLSGLAPEEKK